MRTDSKSCLFLCVLLLLLNTPVPSAAQGKWHGHTDWELKPGDGRSQASGEWFAPISQSTNGLLFSNLGLSGEIDRHDAREITLGIGYRHLYENRIWGGYAFVERRQSADGNAFNQLSFGFEALSESWDARINGYLPDPESKRLRRLDQVDLTNPLVAVRLGQERALPGLDFEMGRRVAVTRDSRVYGGGFYFFDTNDFAGSYGQRLRFESRFYDLGVIGVGSRLTLGAELTYDSEREFRVMATLRLRLPFGSARRQGASGLSTLERRMLDPVIQGLDDITGQGHSDPIPAFIYNSITGSPSDLGVLNAHASGDVHNIVASARDHSVFFVTDAVHNSEVIAVREGQSFFGRVPDRMISVNFFEPDGGIGQLSFMLEGQLGSIHGDDPAMDVFRVPANVSAANVFENITISGGLDGIGVPNEAGAGDNRAKVVVRNSVIENVAGHAISIGDLSYLELDGVTIRKTGGHGVISNSENTIRVTNSTFAETAMTGFALRNRNRITLSHAMIDGTGNACEEDDADALCGAGLAAGTGNTIEVQDLAISNTAWRGIHLGAGNDVTVMDASVRNVGYEGVAASGGDNALRFTGVTIADAGTRSNQEGIQVTGHGNEVVLTDVAVSGTANDGIRITGSDEEGASANTVIFTDVRVGDTRDDGIQIDDNNHVTMTDTHVFDLGGDGLHFGDGNIIELNGFEIRNASGGVGLRLGDDNEVAEGPGAAVARNLIDGTGNACEEDDADALCGAGLAAGTGNTIEVQDLAISNAAWRGIHLGAGNDVTVTDATVRNVGHEGVAASGGDNALRFTGVTIADAGTRSNQEGIQVTGHGNEVVLTDVAVSGTANDGIRITGSDEEGASANTVIFTDVRVSDTRDDGIQIDDNNHVTMTDTHVFDLGGDGLHFGDGNIIELNGFEIRNASGGVGLRLGDDNEVAAGPGAAVARNLIDGTGMACEQDDADALCGAGLTAGVGNTIEVQNLDIANAAWRGIHLGAGNDVTVTDASVRNVGYEGVAASGGDNALRFTGVTIADAGTRSNQEGIQVTGHGNEVVLTDVAVSGTANDGIRITGSDEEGASANTVIFTDVRVGDTRDDGIQIDDNNDVFLTDVRVSNVAGDGIEIGHRNYILLDGFDIRRTGRNGFSLGDKNNVTIAAGTTIERNFIADTGLACTLGDGSQCGAGIAVGRGNEIDIEDLDVLNSAWRGIDLRGGNDVTMTNVEIRGTGYEGVAASGGDNALRFTGVTIADAGTRSNQEGIQVTGHGNEIVLTDVAVAGATNDGIRITGSDEEGASPNTVIFTDVRVSDTRDDGIQIDDNNHVTMTDTHVFDLGGDGLHFGDGNIIELNGFEIRNASGGVGLRLTDNNHVVVRSNLSFARNSIDGTGSACESTGGSIQCGAGLAVGDGNTIEAENLDVTNVAWRGLNFGFGNDVTVTDALVRNVGYEGVAASGGDNALRLTGVTIANVGTTSNQEGIQVTGHSNTLILVDSPISGATGDGIRVTGSNTAGPNATNTVIVDNVTISDIREDGDGIHLDSNNNLTLKDSTFKGIDGRTILVRHSGNVLTDQGANYVDILDCSVHSDTIGIIVFEPIPDTEPTVAGRCAQ